MPLSKLILVRHANPVLDWTKPASEWHLSEEGRRRASALAELLTITRPEVVHSVEYKAVETAELIARHYGVTCTPVPGLHEHVRYPAMIQDRDTFFSQIRAFFNQPDKIVFGLESAETAYKRFNTALEQVIKFASLSELVVVTHGTVLSLWLSRKFGFDPFTLWQQLSMPCAFHLTMPGTRLEGSMIEV